MSLPRVAVVGLGGLGCPAALALAQSGRCRLRLIDDDRVDVSNLQRQILYTDADAGELKVHAASQRLGPLAEPCAERLTPARAPTLLDGVDLIVEGTDNVPTKYFLNDFAVQRRTPLVLGGAVRWRGWALAVADGSACMRCLFEAPEEQGESCEFAGVVAPVVGAIGGLQAKLALQLLAGRAMGGTLYHLDGLKPRLRRRDLRRRVDCPAREPISTLANLQRTALKEPG
ncbi:MAG: HesA/MoeB/ThiF family protein, partial [Myxococcota bacterium]